MTGRASVDSGQALSVGSICMDQIMVDIGWDGV